jgi:hypothetical protein
MSDNSHCDVFISYSRADVERAARLEEVLSARGLKVWRDKSDLRPGDHAEFAIPKALEQSAAVAVLWSENSIKSDWVKHEASYAVVEGKALTLSIAPFEPMSLPGVFRGLNCGDVDATFADPSKLVERYEEVRASANAHGRIDLSTLPETFVTKLYGRDAEMAKLIAAWDEGRATIYALDAMGGAGKTALVYHFVQALKASGWRGARSVFAWSFYSQGSNEDRQTSADDFFRAAFKHFGGPDAEPSHDPREKGVELAHLVQQSRALLILDGLEPLQYAARGVGHLSAVVGGVKDPGVKALLAMLADNNPGLCLVTTRIQLAELRGAEGVVFEPLERLPLMAGIELLRDLGVEPGAPPSLCCLPPRDAFDMLVPAYEPPADYAPPIAAPESALALIQGLPSADGQMPDSPPAPASEPEAGPEHDEAPRDDESALEAKKRPAMPARMAKDLIEAVEELKGHALALTLIGKSLAEDHRGDIRAMRDLPGLPNLHPEDAARDPYRVMRGIETSLARRVADDKASLRPTECAAGRQLAILFFLGLFDRPVDLALLPVVFPEEADYLLPEPDDLALAVKDLIQIKRSLHELKEEREAGAPDSRREEIAQEEAPLIAERDEAIEAARRVLVRRAFAGMAEAVRDGWPIVEALRDLARRGLIAKFDDGIDLEKASIDCHPLVRAYFGARLKELDRDSFKAMHWRLYDHYRYAGLPDAFRNPMAYGLLCVKASFPHLPTENAVHGVLSGELQPETAPQVPLTIFKASGDDLRKGTTLIGGAEWSEALAAFLPADEVGMSPLFAAIAHGCAAEWEDETFNEVFLPRVSRVSEVLVAHRLELHGQSLAALASFFDVPFEKPSPRLSPARASLALTIAGSQLRAIGRLEDAASPMRAGIESSKAQGNWNGAAQGAINLIELLLTAGRIPGEEGALAASEQSVTFADRSGGAGMAMIARTARANAWFQAGGLARAESSLRDAEKGKTHLASLGNFKYCALLLARGRTGEAMARAEAAIDVAKRSNWLLDIALDGLIQARAIMAAITFATPAPEDRAIESGEALAALRRANTEHYLPFGLLAHAEALWRCGEPEAANEPLCEAETIAARGPMPLFMTDAHLLRARIALSQGDLAAAKAKRDAALDLIAKHAYGRAAPELALLTAEIACAENSGSREAAIAVAIAAIRGKPYYDERTGLAIDGGWWGLFPRLELLLPGDDPRRAELRAARDAYNAERNAYLAAEDARGWEEEDRALANPDFRRTLNDALVASGEKPLGDSTIPERRAMARQVLNQMQEAQAQEASKSPEISDALVRHIFADPQAQELLREVMQRNDLSGAPADLPLEAKRAIIAALVEAGAITLGEAPPPPVEAPPSQAEKKKRGWWPF